MRRLSLRRLALIAGLLAAVLAGCGPAGTGTRTRVVSPAGAVTPVPSTAPAGVCAHLEGLDRLLLTRRPGVTFGRHPHFTFPASVTVRGGAARSVARAFCAPAPGAPVPSRQACPMPDPTGPGCEATPATPARISPACKVSLIVTYRLTFWAGRREAGVIQADPGICPAPGPWRVLGRAMGLAHPGVSTFTGGVTAP